MSRPGLCGALLLAAVVAPPAHAQVGLAWKWTKDTEFYVRTETKVQQTLVVRPEGRNASEDREIRQGFVHVAFLHYKVRKVHDDGSAEVVQQIVREVRVTKDPLKKGEEEQPKNDDLLGPRGGEPGAELVLHVTAAGVVTKVEGQDKILDKLAGADSGKRQAVRDALSEGSLKKTLTEALGFLPAAKVKPGASWKRTADLNLGPLGHVEVEHRYGYAGKGDGKDNDLDRIDRTTRLVAYTALPVPLGAAAGSLAAASSRPRSLSFRVTGGRFSVGEGKGTFFFDADKGRLSGATTSMKLDGKLTIHNSDKIYHARLVQEQTTQTTVMDKLPEK